MTTETTPVTPLATRDRSQASRERAARQALETPEDKDRGEANERQRNGKGNPRELLWAASRRRPPLDRGSPRRTSVMRYPTREYP